MQTGAHATPDDLALLRHYAASGDPAAFAELVRRHAPMVFFTSSRVAGRSDVAEDVSQDCFLALARHARTIHGSVAAWLHTTALNRTRELARRDSARRRRESSYAGHAADTTRTETIELIAIVDAALASLPEQARSLIVEHYLSGVDQATIASRTGVDQSTISRRLQRGLEQLREAIGKRGGIASIAVLPGLFAPDLPAPSTLVPSLTKIGLAGVTAKAGATGLWMWIIVGTSVAAAVATGVLLLRSPDTSNTTGSAAPASIPQLLADDGWLDREIEDDDSELEGTMAEITARDVDTLAQFYTKTLGFRAVYRGQDKTVIVKLDDASIALVPSAATAAATVNVFVEDVDATYAGVTHAGAKPDASPAVGRFGLYEFSVLDPEGNRVRFLRETKLP